MAEPIFYLALFLLFYTFLGYPLLLFVLALVIKREVARADVYPDITIIIPAHNEEQTIGAKIENCLAFDYAPDRFNIIVASDGSTDRTGEIAESFPADCVRVVALPFRGGKVVAQNYAIRWCRSEIIVFTDVAIRTRPDCLKLIVQNFYDKHVGVVSCRDAVVSAKEHLEGEKNYIRYDMMVRKYTSQLGSMIGVTGGFYAVRREIAQGGWNPAFPPDFYVAIRCIKRGLRVIEDPRVIAYYKTAALEWDELKRKVRTVNRGMHALMSVSNRSLLNPLRYGLTSFELFSHKLLRWLAPFFFLAAFICHLLLAGKSVFWMLTFFVHAMVYVVAVASMWAEGSRRSFPLVNIAFYFAVANVAIVKAWYEFCFGKKYVLWEPTKR